MLIIGCFNNKVEKKGFQVSEIKENEKGEKVIGLRIDSLKFETRPRNVLLTTNSVHRLVPVYKVNYDEYNREYFTGSNHYHTNYNGLSDGNNWNNNFMPGFEAVYGYNFVNVSHYNNVSRSENKFFDKAVLIKTLYYPSFSKDTLNHKAVLRNFYMVSVYDEDTNKDGFISVKDLRRFYLFDINGKLKMPLVPKNFSVMSSEYDPANDYMYVFAKIDQNKNGQMERDEETSIFWIDLKNPKNVGIQYENE